MDPTPDQVVAANARRLREDRGYTQERVARLMTEAGYPTGEMPLWALENCRRRIKVSDLFGLAAAFDVTPESFLSAGAESDELVAVEYEVVGTDDVRRKVIANSVSADDQGFLNFHLRGKRVFFAPVTAVVCCYTSKEAGDA
ncbi:helix-turn-helix transcriptional regulator [Streptomyces sp. NPDC006173]|uniref:helix-turn-helix domain-containing protein n=1 Tax=Streptomyces sp. NPDC006173 TaxID=3155349 RepID=UPI0033FCB673